jgi:hypothetical protein
MTAEQIKARSERMKALAFKNNNSPEIKSKMIQGLVTYNKSDLGKKKSSEMGKLTGSQNILCYNGSYKHRRHLQSDKHKLISKLATKAYWKDPEIHKKHSQIMSERNKKDWINGKFNNSKIGYGRSGYFKTKFGEIFYRSSYEKHFLSLIDDFDNIKSLARETIRIPYRENKLFVVDYFINNCTLIEIKPQFKVKLNLENTTEKLNAAKQYCQLNSFNWLLLTEDELFSNKINQIMELL